MLRFLPINLTVRETERDCGDANDHGYPELFSYGTLILKAPLESTDTHDFRLPVYRDAN